MAKPFSVVVFHCRHMFHKECLPSAGTVRTFSIVLLHNKWNYFFLCNVKLLLSYLTNMNLLIFLQLFLLSCPRFLGCSFATSAVQRGVGQEVESWRWKSNSNLCTHNIIIDAFIFPLLLSLTVSALIDEYHFPSVTELYTCKNAKQLYWIVSIYLHPTTVKCCCSACH